MNLNGLNIEVVPTIDRNGDEWKGVPPERWEIRSGAAVLGKIYDRRLAEALGVKPLVRKEPH